MTKPHNTYLRREALRKAKKLRETPRKAGDFLAKVDEVRAQLAIARARLQK